MASRQRRSNGSKTELSPGVYRLWVSAGVDPVTGKRRRPAVTFRGTEREAELELARMLAQVGRHSSTMMTLWDFIETMYLPAIEPPELRRRTVDEYRRKLEKYVKPTIGDVRLDKLSTYTMVSWMRGLKSLIANKQTQLNVYRVLSGVLSKAVAWDLLDENVLTRAVEPPVPDEYVPRVLTADEANDYLDLFVGHPIEPVVVLALGGGFRPSEIFALDWNDIDFSAGVVRVTKGMHQRGGETWLEDAKSRSSNRVVVLPDWAVEALKPHRGLGRVCGVWKPGQVAYRYKKHIEASELPWCPLENLRHSHATIGVEAGIPWEDMANRLGHASLRMVKERYVKRWTTRDQQAANVVNDMRRKPDGKKADAAK